MPVPTRPSTGGPIESSWGQEAHDGVFVPTGGRWGAAGSVGTDVNIPMAAVDDPDDWLTPGGTANLIVPADGAGLYVIAAEARLTVAGVAQVTFQMYYGASGLSEDARYWGAAGAFVHGASVVAELATGDEIRFRGTGPVTNAVMVRATLTRIGRSYGIA